jgi:ATP-dependent Clp protease ATP-binding subunit ClpA
MFQRFRQRLRDMGTIKSLCEGAERHARGSGQPQPGAEHFLLASLDLPEGSARRAFAQVHADADQFRVAVARQYQQALRSAGVGEATWCTEDDALPEPQRPSLYRAQPSGQAVMQRLAEWRKTDSAGPLRGAHVVLVVATIEHGVAARSLRAMGVDPQALVAAARNEAAA